MPLFICDCCGAVDNTACGGNFWIKNMEDRPDKIHDLCCKCYTGKWHDNFPYELCTATVYNEVGEWNFVYWMVNDEPRPDPWNSRIKFPKIYIKSDKPRSKTQLKKLARSQKKKK